MVTTSANGNPVSGRMTDLGSNKMPAAVIMGENYDKLLEQCETQELEVVMYFFKVV